MNMKKKTEEREKRQGERQYIVLLGEREREKALEWRD